MRSPPSTARANRGQLVSRGEGSTLPLDPLPQLEDLDLVGAEPVPQLAQLVEVDGGGHGLEALPLSTTSSAGRATLRVAVQWTTSALR
jgi:hypothetical protein